MRARGKLGGLSTSARHDPVQITAKARQVYRESFFDLVDPTKTLDPTERERRATAAYRLHMAKLAMRSAAARRRAA
jgi:hypothetical protein